MRLYRLKPEFVRASKWKEGIEHGWQEVIEHYMLGEHPYVSRESEEHGVVELAYIMTNGRKQLIRTTDYIIECNGEYRLLSEDEFIKRYEKFGV